MNLKSKINWVLASLALSTGIATAQNTTQSDCWPYNQNHTSEYNNEIYSQEDSVPNLEGLIDLSMADSDNIISGKVIYNSPENDHEQINEITITVSQEKDYLTFGRYSSSIDGSKDTLEIESMPFFFIPETADIALTATDNMGQTYFVTDTTYQHDIDLTLIVDANGHNEQLHIIGGSEKYPFGYLLETLPVSTGLDIDTLSTPPFYGNIHHMYKKTWSKYGLWLYETMWPFDPALDHGIGLHLPPNDNPLGIRRSHGCMRYEGDIYDAVDIGDNFICIKNDYFYDTEFQGLFDQEDYNGFIALIDGLNEYRENVETGTIKFGYYPEDFIYVFQYFGSLINEGCQNYENVEFYGLLDEFVEYYFRPLFASSTEELEEIGYLTE
jgi:hypothetical protein